MARRGPRQPILTFVKTYTLEVSYDVPQIRAFSRKELVTITEGRHIVSDVPFLIAQRLMKLPENKGKFIRKGAIKIKLIREIGE
jgi:hypothetical protein